MRHYERKEIEFRQLCMVVRTILLRNPTFDNFEWKAKTSETLAKMGFAEPSDLEMVSRAMRAVEHALQKTLGPRPIPSLPSRPSPQVPAVEPQGRTNRPAGWDLVVRMMGQLQGASTASARLSEPHAETLAITEQAALDEFWRAASEDGADRLALLRAFAEIGIVRSSDWNPMVVRQESGNHRLMAHQCFACLRDERVNWHHIIQIQHGGSNYVRNRVAICDPCHAAVHPWLPGPVRLPMKGWCRVGQLAESVQVQRREEIA